MQPNILGIFEDFALFIFDVSSFLFIFSIFIFSCFSFCSFVFPLVFSFHFFSVLLFCFCSFFFPFFLIFFSSFVQSFEQTPKPQKNSRKVPVVIIKISLRENSILWGSGDKASGMALWRVTPLFMCFMSLLSFLKKTFKYI